MSETSLNLKIKSSNFVSTVDRAAMVLSAFRQSWDFLTLSDIVNYTGLTKPTVFRILNSQVAEGLVFQNEANNSYGLGFLNLRLADVFLSHHLLRKTVLPVMRNLLDQLNENIVLGVRVGERTYDIEVLEITRLIAPSQTCGLVVALHESISGTALLAAISPEECTDYLKGHAQQITALPGAEKKLEQSLQNITKAGFISASGGVLLGGHTIAKSFAEGSATLSITFPLARFSKDFEQNAVQLLLESVHKIGKQSYSQI